MSQVDGKIHNFITIKQIILDRRILVGIILITLLASLIRLCYLGDHSLWYDEAASVTNARSILERPQSDPWGPFAFAKRERVPPLYFLTLAPFYHLANNEWVLRLPSVIFGVLSIPLMYILGTQLANKSVGILAALLLAFSPFHLYYSQEMRPYSLFMFFALLAFVLFHLALQERKNIYFLGIIATVTLGIYTHTYMLFVLFLLDLCFVLNLKTNHSHLSKWLLCHLAIGVLCIPELYLLFYHIGRGNVNLVDYPPGLRSIAGTFYVFTLGRFYFPTSPNLVFIIAQCAIWGFGLLAGGWSLWRGRRSEKGYQALTFILSAFATFLIMWLISMIIIPLFDEVRVHYLIFILPAYIFIVAKGWSCVSNIKLKIALVSTALFISLASISPYFFQWDFVGRGNFRTAAAYIQSYLEKDDVIYHTTNTSTLPIDYYLNWQVQQVLIYPGEDAIYRDEHEFWLVVFKTSSAVDFVQSLFRRPGNPLTVQESSDSMCIRAMTDSSFVLVHSRAYPGKNELSVCQFIRKTP